MVYDGVNFTEGLVGGCENNELDNGYFSFKNHFTEEKIAIKTFSRKTISKQAGRSS